MNTEGKRLIWGIHIGKQLVFCHIQGSRGCKALSLTMGDEMGTREERILAQSHTASLGTEIWSMGREGGPPSGVLLDCSPHFQVRDLNQIQSKCLGKEKMFRQLAPQGKRVRDMI